ncbi:MAG: polyketide synthase dehydratase domain-containing protein, partial [Myxococcota bacterium]
MTKVLLQLAHGELVPSIHSDELNPNIDFASTPFRVQRQLQDWQRPVLDGREQPRIAAISSFGAGGSNAHIIIQEHVASRGGSSVDSSANTSITVGREDSRTARHASGRDTGPVLFVLSARSAERLRAYASTMLAFLERSEHRLTDIVYTLQIGREAMEHRLALCAGDRVDLHAKLSAFLAGESSAEGMFYGDTTEHDDTVRVLGRDGDFQDVVRVWASKGKLENLAELWVKGATLDWAMLYRAERPRRLALPTYPFAQERYWIPHGDTIPMPSQTGASPRPALHPMIAENISDLWEVQFKTVFSGRELFLDDHRVASNKVLPAAGYLEMARVAGELAGKTTVMSLDNVVWGHPVVVAGEPRELTIRLEPDSEHAIAYEVQSGDDALHSRGQLALSAPETSALRPGDTPRIDIAAIGHRCGDRMISSDQLYSALRTRGLEYGPSMRAVGEVRCNHSEAIAHLALPDAACAEADQYVLHPSMVDAALQTIAAIEMTDERGAYLPYAVDKVTIYGPTPQIGYAHARQRGSNGSASYDIDLVDEAGEVRVAFRALTLRPWQRASDPAQILYATTQWQDRPLDSTPGNTDKGRVLLIGASKSLTASLARTTGLAVEAIGHEDLADPVLGRFEAVFQRVERLVATQGQDAGALVVVVDDRDAVESAPVAGLLATARAENPAFVGKLIQIAQLARGDQGTADS